MTSGTLCSSGMNVLYKELGYAMYRKLFVTLHRSVSHEIKLFALIKLN